jgi:hypothetical protein
LVGQPPVARERSREAEDRRPEGSRALKDGEVFDATARITAEIARFAPDPVAD